MFFLSSHTAMSLIIGDGDMVRLITRNRLDPKIGHDKSNRLAFIRKLSIILIVDTGGIEIIRKILVETGNQTIRLLVCSIDEKSGAVGIRDRFRAKRGSPVTKTTITTISTHQHNISTLRVA